MNAILSSRKAAELLGVHPQTVLRWVREGLLPGKLQGPRRRVRVHRSDVLALRASWTVQPVLDFKKAAGGDTD
jgi:excisionase family DNA binding protein